MLDDTKYCPMCEEAGKQLEAAKQRELELLAVIEKGRNAILEQNNLGASWHDSVFGKMMNFLAQSDSILRMAEERRKK